MTDDKPVVDRGADREALLDCDPRLRVLINEATSEWGASGVLRVFLAMYPELASGMASDTSALDARLAAERERGAQTIEALIRSPLTTQERWQNAGLRAAARALREGDAR